MFKKILSVILCIVMVLSYAVPFASAEETTGANEFSGSVNNSGSGPAISVDGNIYNDGGIYIEGDSSVTLNDNIVTSGDVATPEYSGTVPPCDCGCGTLEIYKHTDTCILKGYYADLCSKSAEDIYDLWSVIPVDAQEYIRMYLNWNDGAKLAELSALITANAPLQGEASAVVDGSVVDAIGIPEGGSMTVTGADTADNLADRLESEIEATVSDKLFSWDISIQDEQGADWQPEKHAVQMELQLDGVKLHKYTKVYVAHISDDGSVEYIPAEVGEDGKITFSTKGFSTFAGFTVDFDYEGTQFSINGLESILVSDLMDQLKMPLNIENVADVAFTNTTLVSVTAVDGDWLLTSLKAFQTTEKLALKMKDGMVYNITVTDAQLATMHKYETGTQYCNGNGVDDWYLTGPKTSSLTEGYNSFTFSGYADDTYNAYDSGFEEQTIEIRGPGTYDIALQMPSNFTGDTLYVDLYAMRITKGAQVTIRFGKQINSNVKEIVFRRCSTSDALFWVENGTLTIGNTENYDTDARIVLSGESYNGAAAQPIINMRKQATYLSLDGVNFRNAPDGAIRFRSGTVDNRTSANLVDCIFEDTVQISGNGGAIASTQARGDDDKNYTQIASLTITDCQFLGTKAKQRTNDNGNKVDGDGGAISLRGKVYNCTITGSIFDGCTAESDGGSIYIDGSCGTVSISNCEFKNGSASAWGGAINVESVEQSNTDSVGYYSKMYQLLISKCSFTDLTAGSKGSAVSVLNQLGKFSVTSCEFLRCKATGSGGAGAVALGSTKLADDYKGFTSDMDTETTTVSGDHYLYKYEEDGAEKSAKRTWIAEVEIKGASNTNRDCTFTSCEAIAHAGAIDFQTGLRVEQATIQYVLIDKCMGQREGSAISMADTYISKLNLSDTTIQDCGFTKVKAADGTEDYARQSNGNYYGGGTIRTTGNTTCHLVMNNCTVSGCFSMGNGGGLYWNANNRQPITDNNRLDVDAVKATVTSCTFNNNTAGADDSYGLGGGVFVEGEIELSKCTITNNTANEGGGIMQNIYNNDARKIVNGEKTRLVLDKDTVISGNVATRGGGVALRCKESAAIDDTDKTIFYAMEFVMNGTKIQNNKATTNGGGISFITNSYTEDADKQNEVDRMTKSIEINGGEISGNISGYDKDTSTQNTGNGGGVYMISSENTTLKISDGNIFSNTADGGNGGGIYLSGTNAVCTVSKGIFGGQFAKDEEGNPVATPNIAIPLATTTNGVTTYTRGNGGGIAIFGSARIEMTGGTVAYNVAYVGGGIAVRDGSVMTSERSGEERPQIVYNMATSAGGGIAIHDHSAMVISEGNVSYNEAGYGGGISVMDSTGIDYPDGSGKEDIKYGMVFNGGDILHNTAVNLVDSETDTSNQTYGGGVVLSSSSTMYISGGNIQHNKALERLTKSDGTITESYTEGEEGGGVAVCQGSTMTIEGGSISNNNAYNGGGFCVRASSTVTMSGSVVFTSDDTINLDKSEGIIVDNVAENNGGGIYLWNTSSMTLSGGLVSSNDAKNGGGMAIARASTVTMTPDENDASSKVGGYILNNTATADGGGVYIVEAYNDAGDMDRSLASKFTINQGQISGNKATKDGGGIRSLYCGEVYVGGGIVSNNEAEANGGGISGTSYVTVVVSEGEVSNNKAGNNGGGIYANSYCEYTVSGGKLSGNTSGRSGGGAYGTAHCDFKVSSGEVTGNTAEKSGGGLYVSNKSELTVSGGKIQQNIAKGGADDATEGGGGVAAASSTCYIKEGSVITGNKAENGYGGGIYVGQIETLEVTGGSIDNNIAKRGGGIAAMLYNSDDDVKINGGIINKNTANLYGGGVYLASGVQVTITGGEIKENNASAGGGIIATGTKTVTSTDSEGNSVSTVYSTKVSVIGGSIHHNTSSGSGGGIQAQAGAVVEVKQSEKDSAGNVTYGDISYNSALRGGGVFVQSGASLTVDNGHITYNTATGMPTITTGYHYQGSLKGTGGGVYVGNNNSSGATATFHLTGEEMAIYGNTATFAADDVFANGYGTQLILPEVADMNLSGYGFPAVGWVEDYPLMDSKYTKGLNLGANRGISNNKNVYRYKSANAKYRVMIPDDKIGSTINVENEYVALTLGIPSAQKDAIVIEYGLPVDIDVRFNDFGIESGQLARIGALRPDVNLGEVDYSKTSLDSKWKSKNTHTHGVTVRRKVNDIYGLIRYAPLTMKMTEYETFSYAISYVFSDTTYYFYSSVTVIPATTLYYEDNVSDKDGNKLITYTTYDLGQDASGNVTEVPHENSEWVSTSTSTTTYLQEMNDVGAGSTSDYLNLTGTYGYDSKHASFKGHSGTKAMKVKVDPNTTARATFSFTGTGFDLISLCYGRSGLIMVTVTDSSGNKTYHMVDTFYGYNYTNGQWVPKKQTDGLWMYQSPVLNVTDLSYGTYDVEIYVAYNEFFDHGDNGYYEFILDAIRIYNPADDGVVYGADGKTVVDTTIRDAYILDGEYKPVYRELRDMLINPNNNQEFDEGTVVNGALMMDSLRTLEGNPITNLIEYVHYGPNNEVFLPQTKSISFNMNQGENVQKVQIGLRRGRYLSDATGISVTIYGLDDNNNVHNKRTIDIGTTTDMYYDISDLNGYTVVIENSSTNAHQVSITNIKTTHYPTATNSIDGENSDNLGAYTMDMATAQRVAAYLTAKAVEAPEITLSHPTAAFKDEISYNVYFNVSDSSNISEMGLITFSSQMEDGTIADAVDIIPGAISSGELYMAHTNGISAKNMADTVYFKVYAVLVDGTYVYSDIAGYNAIAYAKSVLAGNNEKAKALVVAMLNYGAAAQVQFGYNTDSLMNAGLTPDQQALVSGYSDSMISDLLNVDAVKGANFKQTGGFSKMYPKVSFEGSFAINYYAIPANAVDGDVTFYYWNTDAVNAAEQLTIENATGSCTMTLNGTEYSAKLEGISARQIDETFVAAIVYESNGVSYCSGLISYSLGAYCKSLVNNADAAVAGLAQATAIYGYYAKSYFAN